MENLIYLSADNQPLTTSLIIAEGAGHPHKNVIALCRKYRGQLAELGRVEFKILPFETSGGTQTREVAELNERQATFILTCLRNSEKIVAFKVALVKAFYEMAEKLKAQNPACQLPDFTNPVAAARAWAAEFEQKQKLEVQLQATVPAVEFAQDVTASSNTMTLTLAAKTLGLKRNEFLDWMRLHGHLYKQSNQATQDAINRGLLVVRFGNFTHKTTNEWEHRPYAHITGKGLFTFYQRLREENRIKRNPKLEL